MPSGVPMNVNNLCTVQQSLTRKATRKAKTHNSRYVLLVFEVFCLMSSYLLYQLLLLITFCFLSLARIIIYITRYKTLCCIRYHVSLNHPHGLFACTRRINNFVNNSKKTYIRIAIIIVHS